MSAKGLLAILLIIFALIAWVFAQIRSARNKSKGKNVIADLKKGLIAVEDITPELVWLIKKVSATEVETDKIKSIETIKELRTTRGQFVIGHFQKAPNGELLLCVFGYMDDFVSSGTVTFDYSDVKLHFFLFRYVEESSVFEIKSEVYLDLAEKHFKQGFAESFFDFLKSQPLLSESVSVARASS